MILIVILVALFAVFFFVRHHTGPAVLATIAGLSVYGTFGVDFSNWIHSLLPQFPIEIIQIGLFLALILIFPLLLYFYSSRNGLFGILRIIEAAIFSVLLTALLSSTVAKFLSFDAISVQISNFISSIKGFVVLAGILAAYFDIIMYRG